MTLFSDIPLELVSDIITLVLDAHPNPTDILCVNRTFYDIGRHILYSRLHFRTVRQLLLFSEQSEPLPCNPRVLKVSLAGGTADFDVFRYLAAALRRCGASLGKDESGEIKQLSLDLLSLCLHSHTLDPNLPQIYDALTLANPRTFVWMGPDPDHHFSIAIVPAATFYLFKAISTWSAIEHITLTNVSFPSDAAGIHSIESLSSALNAPLLDLSALPTLRTLYLGQATLLPPSAIAAMVFVSGQYSLELVRLVDAYRESIWGPRIRRGDIEKAAEILANTLGRANGDAEILVARVRRMVKCEAKTERIVGGDRAEGPVILE